MKLVYLATAPLPYDTPILNELAALVDLHVIYLRDSHAMSSFVNSFGVEPKFEWSTHKSVSVRLPGSDFWSQATIGLSRKLQSLDADVVLSKSWNPFILEALAWKTMRRRRFVMWSESTRFSGLLRGRLSQSLRKMVLWAADRIVTIGSQATAFVVDDLGVPETKVQTSCLPSGVADAAARKGLFPRIGEVGEDSPRFLFVGRLVGLKQVDRLIDAFRSTQAHYRGASLTIIGDGPLRQTLEDHAAEGGTGISFRGWIEGDELGQAMREHDILVLPSEREVWGLVVNEALAHGLFVVATDEVGSAHDLLNQPNLGTRVPARDTEALARALLDAADAAHLTDGQRHARSQSMLERDAANFAKQLARAAELAVLGARHG